MKRFALVETAEPRRAASPVWRICEFCGCKTNAVERICCRTGQTADRNTWRRPG